LRTADAVVVGGGAIGCATAFALARERLAVVLIERDAIAAHASGVAAGMLAPFAEAHGGAEALPLGVESLALFPEWVEELRARTGIDPHFERSGVLRVARSAAEAEALQSRAARLGAHGVEWVDAAAARAQCPALTDAVTGALWSPREAHVDAELLTSACASAAQGLDVRIECGVPATGLLLDGERVRGVRTPAGDWSAPFAIVATGPWSGCEGPALGAKPPVEPVRGQIVALRPERLGLRMLLRASGVYLVPRCDGRLLVGATEERVGFDRRVTSAGVCGLLAAATDLVPALADASFAGAVAGLRPATPDGLPLVGPAGPEGLLLAVGHSRNGILLAPVTGELVAGLVCGKAPPEAAMAFRTDRFSSKFEVDRREGRSPSA